MAPTAAAEGQEPDGLTPFCAMWAATQVFDFLCFPQWFSDPSGAALFLLALGVLARPSASGRFVLLLVGSLAHLYIRSPITPNHVLFEGFVNVALLVVIARHWRRPEPEARAAVFAEAAPVLRGLLLLLYAFACLHKLNVDYLAPATSCAGFMLDGILERVGLPTANDPIRAFVVPLSLLAEGGIPLLLLFPATRRWAVLLAWPFHVGLSFHPRPGIYAFSSMLFALLTLFLPAGVYGAWRAHPVVQRVLSRVAAWRPSWPSVLFGAALAGALVVEALKRAELAPFGVSPERWIRRGGMLLFLPYATALLAALLAVWPQARGRVQAAPLIHVRTPAAALLALFMLNGFAPYLGFQTLRALSMFSNIRTEGGRTNHLFMPASMQVATYQDDLVRLVASSDPRLASHAMNESLLPFTELRRRAWEHPGVRVQVTYERAGRLEVLDTASPGAARQVPPLPFPLHKILAFREVDQDGHPRRCLW